MILEIITYPLADCIDTNEYDEEDTVYACMRSVTFSLPESMRSYGVAFAKHHPNYPEALKRELAAALRDHCEELLYQGRIR